MATILQDLIGSDAVREFVLAGVRPSNWATMRSDFVVGIIQEIKKTQFPYNAVVQREVEKRLGLPRYDDNGSVLSGLVYACQRCAEDESRLAAGFEPATAEFMLRALGGKIAVLEDSLFGGKREKVYNVVKYGAIIGIREPRHRKAYQLPVSAWAKIVKAS